MSETRPLTCADRWPEVGDTVRFPACGQVWEGRVIRVIHNDRFYAEVATENIVPSLLFTEARGRVAYLSRADGGPVVTEEERKGSDDDC